MLRTFDGDISVAVLHEAVVQWDDDAVRRAVMTVTYWLISEVNWQADVRHWDWELGWLLAGRSLVGQSLLIDAACRAAPCQIVHWFDTTACVVSKICIAVSSWRASLALIDHPSAIKPPLCPPRLLIVLLNGSFLSAFVTSGVMVTFAVWVNEGIGDRVGYVWSVILLV